MQAKTTANWVVDPQEIERKSMAAITRELGERAKRFSPAELTIVRRVIHTTADFSYADTLAFTHDAVNCILDVLKAGATIVTDTNMARAGISKASAAKLGCDVVCYMADPQVAAIAKDAGVTRAIASIDKACELEGPLVIAVGNAPTALVRIVELVRQGRLHPTAVIGVPVGFVNVVEAKELLLASDIPAIVARGRRGGSTVATAIVNALLYQIVRPGWQEQVPNHTANSMATAPAPAAFGTSQALPELNGIERVVVFAGTTEGRQIADKLAQSGKAVTVCTATEYGAHLMAAREGLDVRSGRLDIEGMRAVISACDLVIDATHPYAVQVSANIREACQQEDIRCLRLLRPATPLPTDAVVVRDAHEAASYLAGQDGSILVTTGCKEIEAFKDLAPTGRVYARVLPSQDSIAACERAGISQSHIIAMQGPFSAEINVAMLRAIHARYMVTKDSGMEGGMPEKLDAAAECGVIPIVIARPEEPTATYTLAQIETMLGITCA